MKQLLQIFVALIVYTNFFAEGFLLGWASAEETALSIGSQKQLLVDDYIIESMTGLHRELGKVEKANNGKPIMRGARFYGTVLHDDGRFKMWWRRHGRLGFNYAESKDGIKFNTLTGIKGINFAGDYTLSVTLDKHETDPAHRFKAAYDAPGMAAGLAHSRDGISWTPYNGGKRVTHRAADTYNQIICDEGAKSYRLFTRTDFGSPGGDGEVRGSRSMLNANPKTAPAKWKTVRNWIFDREGKQEHKRRQIYAVTDWIYHGVHFGLMTLYEWPGDTSEGPQDFHKRHERDVMNFYIATSRDGDDWDLSWIYASKPMIPRGPDGSFDKDLIIPASTIVTHNDWHWLYYSGSNERHGTPKVVFKRTPALGLARLRLDRFVGLTAERTGTLTTKQFKLDGDELQLNVNGSVRVEILSHDKRPIAGFSGSQAAQTTVDKLRWRPKFGKPLSALKGKKIRLRIHLENATIYAFQALKAKITD